MKRIKHTILILTLTLFFEVSVHADITIFDSNATISDGESYDIVVVKGDSTVVDMTGGDVNNVITMNGSSFNVFGGSITQSLTSYDSSTVNLYYGNLGVLYAYGESKINVFGDVSITHCESHNSSTVTLESNNASLGHIDLIEDSTLNLLAGTVSSVRIFHIATMNVTGGSIDLVWVTPYSSNVRINISGGTTNDLRIEGSSVARLTGGVINGLSCLAGYTAEQSDLDIGIIGYDLSAIPYGELNGYGQAKGFWNDDINFSIQFAHRSTYNYVTLYDGLIPPDCINRPNSDLNRDCKVNFIDLAKMSSEWLDDGTE